MNKSWNLALPAALTLAGLAAIVSVILSTFGATRSDTWAQTRATIETVSGANVSYRYDAGGRTHRATQTVRGTYPAGAAVLVYVNPADPAESFLQLPPRPALWPALAGGVTVLFGVAMAVFFMRDTAPQKQPRRTTVPGKAVRRPAAPMSRLRPPPSVKRTAPDEVVPEEVSAAE